jgi:sulfotransferase family protein
VIWCRRDPRDIAISIYGENFALNEKYASDFSGIAHYIEMQQRLMHHWQKVLPIPILESGYEQLATSIEPEARRIIDFAGLPWNPACLEFHLSDRGVQTPSRWQVKQPIHTRSIGRWRNYAPALGPAFDSLESCRE